MATSLCLGTGLYHQGCFLCLRPLSASAEGQMVKGNLPAVWYSAGLCVKPVDTQNETQRNWNIKRNLIGNSRARRELLTQSVTENCWCWIYQLPKSRLLHCVSYSTSDNKMRFTANYQGWWTDKKVMGDVLKTDNNTVTSCTALYSMALWPGLSSVSRVLQHWQWAVWLISGHWRSLSTAGERPECNGFSMHSFSMVS